jgi:hypothetical protein
MRWLVLIVLHTRTGQASSGRATISVRAEARFPLQVTQSKAHRILSSSLQEGVEFSNATIPFLREAMKFISFSPKQQDFKKIVAMWLSPLTEVLPPVWT